MEIEGTYTLQAPAEDVWKCLMDLQTVQQSIPGLERLTQTDDHSYSFVLQIRYAPLRGSYTGRASVLEQHYPTSYQLKIEGEGQSGPFQGDCAVRLIAHNANTVVSYQATLQLGKSSRLISTTLIKGAIKVLLQQFFTSLADRLRSEREAPVYVTTLEEMYEMPFMEEQLSEQMLSVNQQKQPGIAHRLVRLLGLGQHDPRKEEQWTRLFHQVGIAAMLIFLVWVGTRLPRRASIRS